MAGTQIYSILDAGAYPYTAAGAPGTLVDLAAIRGVEMSTQTTEYENKGDGRIIATGADLDSLELTVMLAAFTPASVAALAGGTVTTSGVAPATITKYTRNVADVVPYVKIAGQTRAKDVDGGAARITYPMAAWRGGPDFGMSLDAFAELSFTLRAQPDANGDFYTYEIFNAYTALA